MSWYFKVLQKYAVFEGRAHRTEYWMFALINFIIALVLFFLGAKTGTNADNGMSPLLLIYELAILLPSLAVTVRRLHDTDRSGWWILIGIVPLIGGIWLLVLMILSGTPGDNRFGPEPV